MFRDVAEYARWFFEQPMTMLRPPARDAVRHFVDAGGEVRSVVLHRHGQFQTELLSVIPRPGNAGLPEHRHPNVDTVEVFLAGEFGFTKNGRLVNRGGRVSPIGADGVAQLCGLQVRVRPQDLHGAAPLGEGGWVFLSLQHWLNGVPPSSVGLDWAGPQHESVTSG